METGAQKQDVVLGVVSSPMRTPRLLRFLSDFYMQISASRHIYASGTPNRDLAQENRLGSHQGLDGNGSDKSR